MPPLQLKRRSPLVESWVTVWKRLSKSVQQRSTLRTSDGGFLPGICGVTSLRIDIPASKLIICIERTIGSKSAVILGCVGYAQPIHTHNFGSLPFRPCMVKVADI
jgi:hypothetical protein